MATTYPAPKSNAKVIDCSTQAELEKALKARNIAKLIVSGLSLVLFGTDAPHIIVDVGVSATIEARETSSPRIVARGTSSPTIVARETSSPRIEAWETSSPRIVARGTSSPRIEARETSSPRIEARETSSPRIEARETSSPRIVAWGTSSPTIEAWGTSSPTIEARETSSPRIEAWGTSSPRIVARETSSPTIEARETSSPRIVAWGTSSPTIVARGYSMTQIKGSVSGTASDTASLNIQGQSKIVGGRQFIVNLKSPKDWCEYYGVRTENGCAIVYKAVGIDYKSVWGTSYAPGSSPADTAWDGRKRECASGGGLNFSPTPRHTHRFVSSPAHYLECRIKLDENFVVHFDGQYPEKCCHKEVAAPLVEVDIDGNPIAAQVEAA